MTTAASAAALCASSAMQRIDERGSKTKVKSSACVVKQKTLLANAVVDQKKLKRLLEYIHGTLDLCLTIGADSLLKMTTFVDAAYGVHSDMRSQTGGIISFGTGGIINRATKQKINTKSSTEAELVGASDFLAHTIWVKNFMLAQGFNIKECFLEQDNESAMKLAKNGRASMSQRSRHIDIRYFWITDRLKQEGIGVQYCPTEIMLADFFTKPLQGALFRKFRAIILNLEDDEANPSAQSGDTDGTTTIVNDDSGVLENVTSVANPRVGTRRPSSPRSVLDVQAEGYCPNTGVDGQTKKMRWQNLQPHKPSYAEIVRR